MLLIPWIKSPFEVPMPVQSTVLPTTGLGASGTTSVEMASRMKFPLSTGPVENAGPNEFAKDGVERSNRNTVGKTGLIERLYSAMLYQVMLLI